MAANFEFCILNHSKTFCSWRKIETYLKGEMRNSSKNYNSLGVILIINRTDAICLAWFLHSFVHSEILLGTSVVRPGVKYS